MLLKNKSIFAYSIIALVILTYNNCGRSDNGGVITGNPLNSQNAAQEIALSLCQVISSCAPSSSPVSSSDCYTNIQPVTNIVSLLGASTNTYPTFGALINANLSGTVLADTAAASTSVNQIEGLSCSSSAVQGIFTSGGPNYSNAAAMIPSTSVGIFPATAIFRSVGPGNTTALATGTSNAMTISGTSVIFASGLPDKVGVGDAIQYQISGTWNIAFISGRSSSTAYTLQNAGGGSPAATSGNTSWSIFRAYTSSDKAWGATPLCGANTGINAAVRNFDGCAGNSLDMVTYNTQWNFAQYADAVESVAATLDATEGWVTSANNYLRIYTPYLPTDVGVSQRHNGSWTSSAYTLSLSSSSPQDVVYLGSNTVLDGLQISDSETGSDGGATEWTGVSTSGNSNVQISNNIIKMVGTATATGCTGIEVSGTSNSINKVWNNIIFGAGVNCAGEGGLVAKNTSGTSSYYFYNNSVVNFAYGITSPYNGTNIIAKNNIVQAATSYAYQVTGSAAFVNSDYNLSNDSTTTGGTHDKTNQSVIFLNSTSGDYRLSPSDTSANGAGEDLSSDPHLPFNTDIQGLLRSSPWSMGASNP